MDGDNDGAGIMVIKECCKWDGSDSISISAGDEQHLMPEEEIPSWTERQVP